MRWVSASFQIYLFFPKTPFREIKVYFPLSLLALFVLQLLCRSVFRHLSLVFAYVILFKGLMGFCGGFQAPKDTCGPDGNSSWHPSHALKFLSSVV